MPNSMTGFGRASAEADGREIVVELKSVNHRYLDINMRMPRSLNFLEEHIRSVLQDNLSRGHIDVYINYKNNRIDTKSVDVDISLLKAYTNAIEVIKENVLFQDDLSLSKIISLPNLFEVTEAQDDRDAIADLCRNATKSAVDELKVMRKTEGEKLGSDLRMRNELIASIAQSLTLRAPEVVNAYKTKLQARITELLDNSAEVDSARLANEVAFFADRANIDEELVRLNSHTIQFANILDSDEPSGRKMDFIVQEMNREFNTIGSKAADMLIVNTVIDGKAEIEKIREQVQNIE